MSDIEIHRHLHRRLSEPNKALQGAKKLEISLKNKMGININAQIKINSIQNWWLSPVNRQQETNMSFTKQNQTTVSEKCKSVATKSLTK